MVEIPYFAVLGGTGLYAMPGLDHIQEHKVATPFGLPSGPIITGILNGKTIAFLARHGEGHVLLPGEINSRANIFALKKMGVRKIISVNAVGSLRQDFAPGDLLVPDQIFDFTKDRDRTFFGGGIVAHISVADPFCDELSDQLIKSLKKTSAVVHQGGDLITIEGPRFSTKAESRLFQSWGISAIGMTTATEAFLAREAEIAYAVMAHVTDYDVWHESDSPVTVEIILERLGSNIEITRQAIYNLTEQKGVNQVCSCDSALANAITTNPNAISPEIRKKLELIVGKYLS